MDFSNAAIEQLITPSDERCACGRPHRTGLSFVRIGPGATRAVPEALAGAGIAHPFIVCDENTYRAAWPALEPILRENGIQFTLHILRGTHHHQNGRTENARILPDERTENAHIIPDERTVGALCMAFTPPSDGILAVGSGVICDCCKVLANAARVPCVVYATAPSMDGYASDSSSMIRDRIKVTLYNACPSAIVADIDIIRSAPMRMLWAGLGDMLAKYVSLCEWRIAHIVTGEYFCENIAGLMRAALQRIRQNAERLTSRNPDAVQAVTEGLVLSGIAMSFAKVSQPASGLEHYFSHMWEMMALERGKPHDLHGIQVGCGTVLTLKLYEKIRKIQPSREKAEAFIEAFDTKAWEAQMRDIFGSAAEAIIGKEKSEYHKNDPEGHAKRVAAIIANWPEILRAIDEELPPAEELLRLARMLGMPITPEELGIPGEDVRKAFIGSREIRDKYIASSLLWDLGGLYETDILE